MNFSLEIVGCYWNEDASQCIVNIQRIKPGSEPREFEEKCDLLPQAAGFLNSFNYQDIKGSENFKAKVLRKLQNQSFPAVFPDQFRYCTLAQGL
jgi:hypothetical protein